jgi:hypothetical protein
MTETEAHSIALHFTAWSFEYESKIPLFSKTINSFLSVESALTYFFLYHQYFCFSALIKLSPPSCFPSARNQVILTALKTRFPSDICYQ